MEFNKKLQELRKQKGLTQEELAQKLFVSRTAVSKWESGRGYPNLDSLKLITKFFSVSFDELMSGEELVTVAEEDRVKKQTTLLDLIFGLLDIAFLLLLFLPLFREKLQDLSFRSVTLLSLQNADAYVIFIYYSIVILTFLLGIFTLILQGSEIKLWLKCKFWLSLSLDSFALFLFILGMHPYAAAFVFTLISVKTIIKIKCK